MSSRKRKSNEVSAASFLASDTQFIVASVTGDNTERVENLKKLIVCAERLASEARASYISIKEAQNECHYCDNKRTRNCSECANALCAVDDVCCESCTDCKNPLCLDNPNHECGSRCEAGCGRKVCNHCWYSTMCEQTGGCKACLDDYECIDCEICDGH